VAQGIFLRRLNFPASLSLALVAWIHHANAQEAALQEPLQQPSGAAPAPTTLTVPTAKPSPPSPTARVVLSSGDHVIIDRGAKSGLKAGTRIAFFNENGTSPQRVIGVGVISAVTENRARVELGSTELARSLPVGIAARVEERQAPSSAPSTRTSSWSGRLIARPFVALSSNGGGGMLADIDVTYRGSGSFSLQAWLSPLGLGVRDRDNVQSVSAFVLCTYDLRYFELGAGLGAQTVNDTNGHHAPGTGTMFPIFARFGALDSLRLSLRVDTALFYSEFYYTGIRAELESPLTDSLWFRVEGGGGPSGYAFGEMGLRARLTSPSQSGSVDLLAGVGGAILWQRERAPEPDTEGGTETSIGGAQLGIGVQYRTR